MCYIEHSILQRKVHSVDERIDYNQGRKNRPLVLISRRRVLEGENWKGRYMYKAARQDLEETERETGACVLLSLLLNLLRFNMRYCMQEAPMYVCMYVHTYLYPVRCHSYLAYDIYW